MGLYNDEYNREIADKVTQRSARHAIKIDRLGGAGRQQSSGQEATAAQMFQQQNEVFKSDIERNLVQPRSVVKARANLDLGSGKHSSGGGMVGFPPRAPISAVEPSGVVRERADLDLGAGRSGAGFMDKFKKGLSIANKAGEAFLPENSKLRKGLDIADQTGQVFGQGMSGGIWPLLASVLASAAPAVIEHFSGKGRPLMPVVERIAKEYLSGKIRKGELTKRLRSELSHGMKRNAPKLSSAIVRIAKKKMGFVGRGQYDQDEDDDQFEFDEDGMHGGALPMHSSGCGNMSMADRKVGGRQCCPKCKCNCGGGESGAGMSGGFAPFAPTTEALAGYDNRNQPKGLKPPPSVNQQPGMCGSGISGSAKLRSGRNTAPVCSFPASRCRGNKKYGGAQQPVSMQQMGRSLLPRDQLPSGIGGMMCPQNIQPVKDPETGQVHQNRCKMMAAKKAASGGRDNNLADYAASSSGAIIPELQSRKSNIGSGARASRGAMVAKLMKERGMTLGEASKALKGGAYTANDFFQPRNIHQFFGAYA